MSVITQVNIVDIANKLIEMSGFTITNLKLNKLLYYVYGVNLVFNPNIKVNESPQAWDYGPVFPSVYHTFKKYGIQPISEAHKKGFALLRPELPQSVVDAIQAVWDNYGNFSESELISRTHVKGRPWDLVYDPNSKHVVIPDDSIKEYFEENVVVTD